MSKVCDFVSDCTDGSDESLCRYNCDFDTGLVILSVFIFSMSMANHSEVLNTCVNILHVFMYHEFFSLRLTHRPIQYIDLELKLSYNYTIHRLRT